MDDQSNRRQIVEENLCQLLNGRLPFTEKLIFNSVFNFRRIKDSELFQSLIKNNSDCEKLFENTQADCHVKVSLCQSGLSFNLFVENPSSIEEATFYAKNFTDVIALTYAALGLDMSGLSQMSFLKEGNKIEAKTRNLLLSRKSND